MRITGVTTISRPMATSWLTESVIATPMSGYTRHMERRSSWFGRMIASLVCIETEDGLTGLAYIGGGKTALRRRYLSRVRGYFAPTAVLQGPNSIPIVL